MSSENKKNNRALKAGGYSLLTAALVIAIAVFVNLIIGRLPSGQTKIDMTKNNLYSLSDQTKQILKSLDKDITVYWIVPAGSEDSMVSHLLDSYTSASSRIKVEKKDPIVYPDFATAYTKEQMESNSLIVVNGDKSKYVPYSNILVTDMNQYYSTGKESQTFEGESALTNAVSFVTASVLPKLYTLSGHGEADLDTDLWNSVKAENFTVNSLSLLTSDTVPSDAGCLIINTPEKDISSDEAGRISSYLKNGGRLILVTESKYQEFPNLYGVMKEYGMSPVPGVVVEQDAKHFLPGYNYMILPGYGNHAIVQPLQKNNYYILMPTAQGIAIDKTLPDGVSVTELLNSSRQSYSKKAGYKMSTYEKEDGDTDGPFTVAAAAEGPNGSKITWYTSGTMFTSDMNQTVSGGNFNLFLNSISWLCDNKDSISIRAKSLDESTLVVPDADVTAWKIVMLFLIPFGILAIGILVGIRRRKQK